MKIDAWLRSARKHPLAWGMPMALVVVNLGLLLFYQLVYAGKVEALEERFADENAGLEELVDQRSKLSSYLDRVRTSRGGINALYLDHFKTMPERLTATLTEIERLAATARIKPPSFSYPALEMEELQLQQMGINFGVEGTYEQLRSFINLLQVSDHFLILRSITLNRASDRGNVPRLNITFSVSTIFVTKELAAKTLAARRAEQASVSEAGRDTTPASSVDPSATEPSASTDTAEEPTSDDAVADTTSSRS